MNIRSKIILVPELKQYELFKGRNNVQGQVHVMVLKGIVCVCIVYAQ